MSVNSVKDYKGSCKPEFPKLMEAKDTGQIVHFYKSGKGQCVYSGSTDNQVGLITDSWHMDPFTDFTGSITLSNES